MGFLRVFMSGSEMPELPTGLPGVPLVRRNAALCHLPRV